MEAAPADYNITKTVSLKDIDPMALLRLKMTGTTDFSVGEILYDMDFPGQYMRRIRSVSVSIPATLEANSSINAVLTLLQHKYRLTQSAADYANSQTDIGSEAFRTDRIPISSIAVSSGDKDSGVFELDFSGPRYMPFEGAGAISTWRIVLPAAVRKFNYETITDVILHVQYTAYEGGPTLKAAANRVVIQAAKTLDNQSQQQGFWALWDLKNDFAGGWTSFNAALVAEAGGSVGAAPTLALGDIQDHLPSWARLQTSLEIRSITFVSRSQQLINRLDIPQATTKEAWSDGKLGDSFTKQCNATETTLNWDIVAQPSVAKWEATMMDNVYLVVHYVLKGI